MDLLIVKTACEQRKFQYRTETRQVALEMTWISLAVIATQISSGRCSSRCCFDVSFSDV